MNMELANYKNYLKESLINSFSVYFVAAKTIFVKIFRRNWQYITMANNILKPFLNIVDQMMIELREFIKKFKE